MGIIQDRQGVRQLQDIEQKYNLGQMKSNLEIQSDTLVKVENELFNTIATLIINLEGLIESQHELSCWFYFGEPSNAVEPESEWITTEIKDLHIGDLYYNKASGRAYQYQSDYIWLENIDIRLIQALALTNSNIVGDERKIYFERPTPPYTNGDWWIQDNGDLWICQITRGTEFYVENDFIISPLYTTGVNNSTANQLTILSGAITTIRQGIDSITQIVASNVEMIDTVTNEITNIQNNYTTLAQTSSQIDIAITNVRGSITEVTTTTGFKFDANGLLITKTGEQMSNLIDNDGLLVKRDNTEVLKANSDGVNALNITARQYLSIGTNSRMEDYEDGTGVF